MKGRENLKGDGRGYKEETEVCDDYYVPIMMYQDATSFEWHILNGSLMRKFWKYNVFFPFVPTIFRTEEDYQDIWQHLLQYEVYFKIMSPTRPPKKSTSDEKDGSKYTGMQQTEGYKSLAWIAYCSIGGTSHDF